MNTQRITISIPSDVYSLLSRHVGTGKVSRYVAEMLRSRLIEEATTKKIRQNPVENFLALRKRILKLPTKTILNSIHKGRRGYL